MKGALMQEDKQQRIPLGISSCLLGNPVRFDGGHKQDRYITDTLAAYFSFVSVCPEVECGLPVPREAMHLEGDPATPRLVTVKSHRDLTEQMQSWAAQKIAMLQREDLCGFIFKSRSPSSGMARVKVYGGGQVRSVGVGIFARMFMDAFPLLPVEDEGRLHDIRLRENFIESIFLYKRWRDVCRDSRPAALVQFHTRHKLLILAHSEKMYRSMGPLVAQAGKGDLAQILASYQELLMAAMKLLPTIAKHVNVLMHMLGYFKKILSTAEKQEMLDLIEQFRGGFVPLIVPVTLLNHYIRKYDQQYLLQQYYLNPHPLELKLRNHA